MRFQTSHSVQVVRCEVIKRWRCVKAYIKKTVIANVDYCRPIHKDLNNCAKTKHTPRWVLCKSNGLKRLIGQSKELIICGSIFYHGINKPVDKNSTGQRCGTKQDAEHAHPNDSCKIHRGYVTVHRR